MIDITRETLAYGIIAGSATLFLPWLALTLHRQHRRRLRRRGIKSYGH